MSWLFVLSSYRSMYEENIRKDVRLAELERSLQDLTRQLEAAETRRDVAPDISSLIQEFRDHVLDEQPFPDNEIPENMFLTPSYPESVR